MFVYFVIIVVVFVLFDVVYFIRIIIMLLLNILIGIKWMYILEDSVINGICNIDNEY